MAAVCQFINQAPFALYNTLQYGRPEAGRQLYFETLETNIENVLLRASRIYKAIKWIFKFTAAWHFQLHVTAISSPEARLWIPVFHSWLLFSSPGYIWRTSSHGFVRHPQMYLLFVLGRVFIVKIGFWALFLSLRRRSMVDLKLHRTAWPFSPVDAQCKEDCGK